MAGALRRVDWVAVPLPAGAPKPWLARTPPDVRAHRSRLEFSRAMVTTTTTSRLPLLEAGEQSVILQTDIRSRFGEAGVTRYGVLGEIARRVWLAGGRVLGVRTTIARAAAASSRRSCVTRPPPLDAHGTGPSSIHAQLPSAAERRAAGRAARERLKRTELARWKRTGATNPVAMISAQNDLRLAELLPIRHARMATSPWAYYRGAAAVMAADLASRATRA